MFSSNNDPKHTAKAAHKWFLKNIVYVLELESRHPLSCPFVAGLEKFCSFMTPHNLTELLQFYRDKWGKISVSRCTKLFETYPHRFNAVTAAKGAANKY